jgi:hypothetical protein
MQYVQTGTVPIYSQVDKTVLQARMGSTACSLAVRSTVQYTPPVPLLAVLRIYIY